jgi:iron complex outermembrane receptor protein
MRLNIWGASLSVLALAVLGQTAQAQQVAAAPGGDAEDETIIVTGTRQAGVKARDSSTPIEVVTSEALTTTGLPNLSQELTLVVPSFSSPTYGGDTAALTTAAVLRGLSPNDVLVLVNGKRRNASANLFADPGPQQGSNPVDLDFIPASAIDHVEVLTDGAAAQYGSDAIGGVINIILKNADHGGSVTGTTGAYYGSPFSEVHQGGDGFTIDTQGNDGIALGTSGYLNLSAEYKHHDNSNITGPDPRGAAGGIPPDPFQSRIDGDPESSLESFVYNTGYQFGDFDFYATGTVSYRHAKAFENYRTETKAAGLTLDSTGAPLPNPYPLGFEPAETITEYDYDQTIGLKGVVGAWRWDLSSTYGADLEDIGNVGGLNIALYQVTGNSNPHVFRTGNLNDGEWTNNLDVTRDFEIGLASPLSVAYGAEYRLETFQLVAGDPASRFLDGSQANPGFSLSDAHNVERDNEAVYADLATDPIPHLKVDVAGRFEHYSDFGDTQDGKISTRYDFTPDYGLRATVSNGFRAPSLAQEFFSATNVGPGFASAQLPVNSPGAAFLGAQPLKPEISTNYSFGFVAQPATNLHVTLDAYQIDIRNRIIDSGLVTTPNVAEAIALNGNVVEPGDAVSAQFFANAAATHTRGVDITASYPFDLGDNGEIEATITGNYNNTIALITANDLTQFGVNSSVISYLTTAAPREKIILDGFWQKNPWDVNLRGTFYGSSHTVDQNEATFGFVTNQIDPAFIVDLEGGYTLGNWHFVAGANNLFNTFPNKVNPATTSPTTEIYNFNSPFGYQGGFYHVRISYNF